MVIFYSLTNSISWIDSNSGYMSPEYAMEGSFSVKSDTYSFGVLLLEIVSGLKISSSNLIMDFPSLIAYVSIVKCSIFNKSNNHNNLSISSV